MYAVRITALALIAIASPSLASVQLTGDFSFLADQLNSTVYNGTWSFTLPDLKDAFYDTQPLDSFSITPDTIGTTDFNLPSNTVFSALVASGEITFAIAGAAGGLDLLGTADDFVLQYDNTSRELGLVQYATPATGRNGAIEFSGSYRIIPMTGGAVPEAASSLTWLGLLGMAAMKRCRSA